MSVRAYIQGLDLKDISTARGFDQLEAEPGQTRSGATATTPTPLPTDLKAAVDAGSVLSFVDGVSTQERDDVLYSVQLAHRGASGAFDRFSKTEDWYRKFTEILEKVGWAGEQFAFTKYDQSEGELHMDKAALEIIGSIATGSQLTILTKSLEALRALAAGDSPITLFDFHTSAESSGNFQIGAVQKSDNSALSLAIGGFHFEADDNRRRFLFWKWGKQEVDFWTAASKMTLNEDLYSKHRDTIREKLGVKAGEFIAALELE